jgi:SEC-C motif-containing protein
MAMMMQHRQAAAAAAAARASPRAAAVVARAAPAQKGFGANANKAAKPSDGCPCGSGLLYKACCKPHHQPRAPPPPTVEATVRARFSAVVKKEMPFLLKTFHPNFHCIQYNTEPGGAADKLEDDMWRTCTDFENSNLRIMSVKEAADKPGEFDAEIQYTTANLRAPELDGNGNKRRLVRMERDRFVQNEQGWWQLADYQLADVPEALVKAAGKAKDLPPLEKKEQEQEGEPAAAA